LLHLYLYRLQKKKRNRKSKGERKKKFGKEKVGLKIKKEESRKYEKYT
jgi:hypothetical protein